jgi:hypothetical protein
MTLQTMIAPLTDPPAKTVGVDGKIVSASKIHLLGLEAIQARLGEKWGRMSDLVHRYFEAAIRREMRPGDTFCSSGELSYLVLFRDLTVSEARLKCGIVVEEVCRKLFGDQEEEISIRSLIAPMDMVDLDDMDNRTKLDATLERVGQETIFSSLRGVEQNTGETLHVEMVNAPTFLQAASVSKPSFVYRPLWDSARSVVLTYICQLLPESARGDAMFSAPYSTDSVEKQIILDEICLQECLRRATDLRQLGLRVLIAIPIHFSTLCRAKNWTRYRSVCESVSLETFRDIAFLLYGFDSGVPHIRLVQELPKLTRFSPHLYCIVDNAEAAGHRFRNTGAHAIGIALQSGTPEKPWIEKLNLLARDTHGGGPELFVLGAAARSAAINAIGAGARYLEGPAVRSPLVDPRNAFAQEIQDLFRS